MATIQAVLARKGRMGQRKHKLNMVLTVLLLIVQHIYSNLSQRKASKGLRYVWPDPEYVLIAHYAIRALMHQAALHQQLDPDRLSFVHALEVVRDAIAEFQMTARHLLVELLQRLWRDLVRYLLPKRRNRTNPRVVKRKMSKFHLKRPEHARSPQPTIPFHEAVVLLPAATRPVGPFEDGTFAANVNNYIVRKGSAQPGGAFVSIAQPAGRIVACIFRDASSVICLKGRCAQFSNRLASRRNSFSISDKELLHPAAPALRLRHDLHPPPPLAPRRKHLCRAPLPASRHRRLASPHRDAALSGVGTARRRAAAVHPAVGVGRRTRRGGAASTLCAICRSSKFSASRNSREGAKIAQETMFLPRNSVSRVPPPSAWPSVSKPRGHIAAVVLTRVTHAFLAWILH